MKKFVLTEVTKEFFGIVLYQIKATRSFGDVEEGDLGGWVQKEDNLAQVSGNAWVYGNARVSGNAQVSGNARVSTRKHIAWFSSVGSESGTLTAYMTKTGEIEITRGCFRGTVDTFVEAVERTHESSRFAEEYLVLVQYIRLRFREVTVEIREDDADEADE